MAPGPKLFGSADGTLVPPTVEINLSGIAAIALGCLSDIDKESFAAPAGPLEFGGLPTRLYPVVGTPFEHRQEQHMRIGAQLPPPPPSADSRRRR